MITEQFKTYVIKYIDFIKQKQKIKALIKIIKNRLGVKINKKK